MHPEQAEVYDQLHAEKYGTAVDKDQELTQEIPPTLEKTDSLG